jgi:hypothetical protein
LGLLPVPHPIWMARLLAEQPEVVMENEVPVGPDGLIKIVIDTTAAKELHGDTDHKYAITAEVVDESRRTIVGTGNVIASRKPFSVLAGSIAAIIAVATRSRRASRL